MCSGQEMRESSSRQVISRVTYGEGTLATNRNAATGEGRYHSNKPRYLRFAVSRLPDCDGLFVYVFICTDFPLAGRYVAERWCQD